MIRNYLINTMCCAAVAFLLHAGAAMAQGIDSAPSASESYRLGPGDVVSVQVFGEGDLTRDLKLGEDGRINYAFVGPIQLQGLTVLEVEQEITGRLNGDYLLNPQVQRRLGSRLCQNEW